VTAENALSVKYLHILLFKVEGLWSYAQNKKQLASKDENNENSRLKFHAAKRLRLAHLQA